MHAAEAFPPGGPTLTESEAWSWNGPSHIVIDNEGELYRVPVDVPNLRVSGPPERITFGSGLEALPTGSTNGKIAFTQVQQDRNIFELRLDPRTGLATGDPTRLTTAQSRDTGSDVTPDGNRLVYISNRDSALDLWALDLKTGKESNLSNDPAQQWLPVLSPDGEQVAYLSFEDDKPAIYQRPFAGGVGRPLCADCGWPRSWSADGRFLLFERGDPLSIHALEVATGQHAPILSGTGALSAARISPDGKWVAFRASGNEAGLRIAPFRGGEAVPETEWIALPPDNSVNLPAWSADGGTLYFTSGRAGTPDIWMQRLEPSTKRPAGEAQVVRRFPFMRYSIRLMDEKERRLAVTQDRLVFPMSDLAGSIWLMEPREPPQK
jgi:TolB protein